MPALATVVAIAGVIGVTLWQLHLNLLLTEHHHHRRRHRGPLHDAGLLELATLLPGLHLTGWDPGWYDGYPIYTFYFVLPDALIALGSHLIPYGIAFKWATVLGSVLLPVAAWACGRLFRLRPPGPAALAAATLPFLFDYTFTIYGGNLFSTLAGEYAYSLSAGARRLVPRPVRPGRAHRPAPRLGGASCWPCASSRTSCRPCSPSPGRRS